MLPDDDDGLPDEAFTELEREAGVPQIMRSGGDFWSTSKEAYASEDDDDHILPKQPAPPLKPVCKAVYFQTFQEAMAWADDHPDQPFTRAPNGRGFVARLEVLFGDRRGYEGRRAEEFYKRVNRLSPHLGQVLETACRKARSKHIPLASHKFANDLSLLDRLDLVRLKDLLEDHVEYERAELAALLQEIARDRRMRHGDYGQDEDARQIEVEERALDQLTAWLQRR